MREHRQIYKATHRGNVPRCVEIGVVAMPANLTQKLGLGFPVALVDMPAFAALPRSIARVNNRDRNSGLLGFVLDKGAKLAEAPIMQSVALLFSGLNRLADMRQIFERNTEAGAFSSGNDCFGNTVILVLLKPFLLAAHLAKTALCCSGAYALQCCSALRISLPVRFNRRAGVLVAEAIGGNVNHAQINPEYSAGRKQLRIVKVAHGGEIPLAAHQHQINLTLAMFKQFALVVAASIGNLVAPGHQPDRNSIVGAKAKDAVIVRLRGMFAESALRFLVNFVSIRNLCDAAHCDLSGYFKLGSKVVIAKFVKIVLPKNFSFPSLCGKPVASIVASLKRGEKQGFLIFRRLQFEVGYEFHTVKYRGVY